MLAQNKEVRSALITGICCAFIISLSSCITGNKKGRPSPYAMDSISMGSTQVSISYSSPGVKDRKIWGDLVPFNRVWRTGANEATIFETSADILVQGERLPVGKYSLFTIPGVSEWIIIFNRDWDQWGAYNYQEENDALRIVVNPQESHDHQERMEFKLAARNLIFNWERITFSIPLENAEPAAH